MTAVAAHPLGARMAAEMAEQPERLAALVAAAPALEERLRARVPGVPAGVSLVARGSSDHAAATGRYLLAMATRRPVGLASPSLASHYGVRVDYRGHLVVALSQSGRTPEIVRFLAQAREDGATTVAITNDAGSALAQAAHETIDLGTGPELAVPATKTVTAELVALALLARALGPLALGDADLALLPDHVAALLADPGPAEQAAAALAGARTVLTVARGLLLGAALETALKLQETTGLPVLAWSAADLRHGPIAIARPGVSALAFAAPGPTCDDVRALCGELAARGAATTLAGPFPGAALPWPEGVPEALAPVLAVVRGQQVALALARSLGRDPDRPAGLSKVTLT